MRKVAVPCLYHLFAAGILSYLLVRGLGLDAGTAGLLLALGIAAIVIRSVVEQRRASEPTSRSDV